MRTMKSPLRKWRGERTQEDVAAMFDITPATLSRIERFEQWPQRELAERICDITGLSMDALAGRVRKKRTPA